jgi:hypothetical protein
MSRDDLALYREWDYISRYSLQVLAAIAAATVTRAQ